jgi:hypothetical protein
MFGRISSQLEGQQGSTMQSGVDRQIITVRAACSLRSHTDNSTSKKSEDMRRSQSCLAIFLSLMLLAGLTGCGPASSDNPPNPTSRANVSETPISKQETSPGNNPLAPVTQVASSVSLASGSETGGASGKGTVSGGEGSQTTPVSSSKSAEVLEPLVVPAWIAKDLESPDIGTRLRALDTWVQTAPPGADDPLILALENKDERVRARAMELIEQNWARAAGTAQ